MFALGGVGAAGAVEVDTQDLATTQHATIDAMATHESSGSDAPATPACHLGCSSDPADAASSNGERGATGAGAHPHGGNHRSLGWQSLLPGSIQ